MNNEKEWKYIHICEKIKLGEKSLRVTATMNLYCNFILLDKKMADFEHRQFKIGLKFVR